MLVISLIILKRILLEIIHLKELNPVIPFFKMLLNNKAQQNLDYKK